MLNIKQRHKPNNDQQFILLLIFLNSFYSEYQPMYRVIDNAESTAMIKLFTTVQLHRWTPVKGDRSTSRFYWYEKPFKFYNAPEAIRERKMRRGMP